MPVTSLAVVLAGRSSGLYTHQQSAQQLTAWALQRLSLSSHNSLDISHHSAPLTSIHLDPEEGRYLAAGAGDGSLYVHDVRGGELALHVGRSHRHCHKYSIASLSWGQDSGILISSSKDGVMKVWDPNNPRKPVDLFVIGRRLYRHAVSENGSVVAAGGDSGHVTLVDLRSGSTSHVLRGGHQADNKVFTLAWALDQSTLLASGGADRNILLWDIRRADSCLMRLDSNNTRQEGGKRSRSRQETAGWSHQSSVLGLCWTHCGRWLVSVGADNRIRKWDPVTGRRITTEFPVLAGLGKDPVDLVCTSGADRDSLMVGEGAAVRMFDVETGRSVRKLTGHYSRVTGLVYNHESLELYSAGRDKHILTWSPARSEEQDLGHNLTRDSWSSSEED